MARDPNRLRIDYFPGPAARNAMEEARKTMPPGASNQHVIDRLMVMGLFAIRTEAARAEIARPSFADSNRHYWRPDQPSRSGTVSDPPRVNSVFAQASSGTTGD